MAHIVTVGIGNTVTDVNFGNQSSIVCSTTVTNTNNAGDGSLRSAIDCANATAGTDTVDFNIAGAGPHTITPLTPLPNVTEAAIIDGTTEPNFAGTPVVALDGSSIAAAPAAGIKITGGGSTVRGLAIHSFPSAGIDLRTAGNNVVEGNYLGTGTDGTTDLGNGGNGIVIVNSPNNVIGGGTTAAARNIISGNSRHGVSIVGNASSGNIVSRNYIGIDAGGSALPNDLTGVRLGSPGNTVGGAAANARNVISGNGRHGVFLVGAGATGNVIEGNRIGTNVAGTAGRPNGIAGVVIRSSASGNTLRGNDIAFNGKGVIVSSGAGNTITANSFFDNVGIGIDLGNNGVTPNDADDPDAGANNLQNFPVINTATLTGGNLEINYSVPSTGANAAFPLTLEFFIADASNREGRTFLGIDTYNGPGAETATIAPGGAAAGNRIVATATDANGNTSELSFSRGVTSPAPLPKLNFLIDDYLGKKDEQKLVDEAFAGVDFA